MANRPATTSAKEMDDRMTSNYRHRGERNMKKVGIVLAAVLLLAVPLAWAAIRTTTQVNFNVDTVLAYTVTLPGESAVAATVPGAATTAIEFNSTTGTDANVNARVVGGTAQSSGTPIMQFDNTGTVNLNLSVQLNAALPGCMALAGATTYAGADTGAAITPTTNTTVVDNYGPNDAAQDWYMKTDFTACTYYDTNTKTLTTWGIQAN
jgi:hypothetical protein